MSENKETIDQMMASCSEAAQEIFENAGSDFGVPDDGDYAVALGAMDWGSSINKKSNKKVAKIYLPMTLVDAPDDVASAFPDGFKYTFWGNSYDDASALKQLAGLLTDGGAVTSYEEAVRVIREDCNDKVVQITLSTKKERFRKIVFKQIIANLAEA